MGIWADRTYLASKGWNTDLRIQEERNGAINVGLWAKSWFWQGRVSEISLRAHRQVSDSADLPAALDRVAEAVREALERAEAEFRDTVPCVTGVMKDGRIKLAVNAAETQRAFEGPVRELPAQAIRFAVDAPEAGTYRQAVMDAASIEGLEYNDALNNYAEARYLQDTAPREWQFECRPRMRRLDGELIRADHHQHSNFSARLIDEDVAASLVSVSSAALRVLFDTYGPGGRLHGATETGLPPGYESVKVYLTRQREEADPSPDF